MWPKTFLLLILLSSVLAARRGGGSHTYPSSRGRSGTGSGSGGYTYPHSTHISGGDTHVQRTYTQEHKYVQKTNVHSYPPSQGQSGTGSGGGTRTAHAYPPQPTSVSGNTHGHQTYTLEHKYVQKTNVHSYPPSQGQSGTGSGGGTRTAHAYPPQPTSVSGNTHGQRTYTQQHNYVYKTEVHHHYHYNPPQRITYGSTYHPVYHGPPPVYVYEYRDSGSRFDSLLTGLALYNLGRMSANHNYNSQREYRPSSNEICKLGISKQNGDYEETRIDCKLMSSFIWEYESQPMNQQVPINTFTTSVVQSTNVVDALQVKGPSIQVTKGMNCFMIRISRDSSILRKEVECGLLQAYAQNSLYSRNNNNHLLPCSATILFFVIFIIY